MKTPRPDEDESPNLRPHQQLRTDMNDPAPSSARAGSPRGTTGTSPPVGAGMPSAEGVLASSSTAEPPVSELTVLMQMMQMMAVQQQAMQQQLLQFQSFLEHQARVQSDIFEKQAKASKQRSKAANLMDAP
ncbi:hypothetical protein PR003_g15123 [Phytophthora rubi]|uniref:Uncharacterized protein n=2 Tax=Phytophthora rubi TaxID=129364 RepID=A0A6A3LKM3_9STRA|nr:hypothetical protein PR001_g13720 [Phytophthora rubi]KAE9331198.1 hypothetical protein PR003_g15123 [Phytophthora rubi]